MRPTCLLIFAGCVTASASRRATAATTNTEIVQLAMSLELLQNAFYVGALSKFNASDFASDDEQALFTQIAGHGQAHVELFQGILGNSSQQPCTYNFSYTDVKSFRSMATVLENVIVSFYITAVGQISDPLLAETLTTVLTNAARHAAWVGVASGEAPWSLSQDAPLDIAQAARLVAPFVSSCPTSNSVPLPTSADTPVLQVTSSATVAPGENITLSLPDTHMVTSTETLYALFLRGPVVDTVPYTVDQPVMIPADLNATGLIYVLISNNTNASDAFAVAGPAILQFGSMLPDNGTSGTSGGPGSASNPGGGPNAASYARPVMAFALNIVMILSALLVL